MKKGIIFILALLLFIDCTAQIIINKPVDIVSSDIIFNPDMIFKNKIKRIDVIISDKPDGSIILDKGAGIVYKFNEAGYITRYIYTVLNKKEIEEVHHPAKKKHGKIIEQSNVQSTFKYVNDTINVYFFYDFKDHIIAKRIKIEEFFNTYYYEYNEQGEIRKEFHCNETNISANKKDFKLGEQKILSSEIFEYVKLTNTQTKKKTLNDHLNVYKKAIINCDDKNNKISEYSEFIVSCIRQEDTYVYDKCSRLIKHAYANNEKGELKMESIYEYDKNGNLLSEKKLKNDVITYERHFIYDENNTLIKSEVDRDHLNSTVIIKKYEYTYY